MGTAGQVWLQRAMMLELEPLQSGFGFCGLLPKRWGFLGCCSLCPHSSHIDPVAQEPWPPLYFRDPVYKLE